MATGPDASGSGGLGLGYLGGLAMRGMVGACTRLRMVALPCCDPGKANFDEPGRCCGLMPPRLREFPGAVLPGVVLPEPSCRSRLAGVVCQKRRRRPEAAPWTVSWTFLLPEVGEHPVDGGLALLVGQRRVAALGRHDTAVRAGVAIGRVGVELRGAQGDARGTLGVVIGRGVAPAGGVAGGAQVVEGT